MYPYFRAWTQVRRRLDPLLLFTNSYMDRIFYNQNLNQSQAHLFARKSFDDGNSSWSSIISIETVEPNESVPIVTEPIEDTEMVETPTIETHVDETETFELISGDAIKKPISNEDSIKSD